MRIQGCAEVVSKRKRELAQQTHLRGTTSAQRRTHLCIKFSIAGLILATWDLEWMPLPTMLQGSSTKVNQGDEERDSARWMEGTYRRSSERPCD